MKHRSIHLPRLESTLCGFFLLIAALLCTVFAPVATAQDPAQRPDQVIGTKGPRGNDIFTGRDPTDGSQVIDVTPSELPPSTVNSPGVDIFPVLPEVKISDDSPFFPRPPAGPPIVYPSDGQAHIPERPGH